MCLLSLQQTLSVRGGSTHDDALLLIKPLQLGCLFQAFTKAQSTPVHLLRLCVIALFDYRLSSLSPTRDRGVHLLVWFLLISEALLEPLGVLVYFGDVMPVLRRSASEIIDDGIRLNAL